MTKTNQSILKILNLTGACLVVFGISFLISTNWNTLNDVSKIIFTLGIAILTYIIGVMCYIYQKKSMSSGFFLISALTLPIGLAVFFNITNYHPWIDNTDLIITSFCLTIFAISQFFLPNTLFVLFIIIFSSQFYISLLNYLILYFQLFFPNLFEYEIMTLGVSYLLLGNYFNLEKKSILAGPLFFVGTLFLLFASYSLGGLYYYHSELNFWKIMTAILIFFTLILSVPFKSKSMLYLAAFFLIIYIVDMSATFIDIFGKFGWPLVLVCLGFLLISVGYVIVLLKK